MQAEALPGILRPTRFREEVEACVSLKQNGAHNEHVKPDGVESSCLVHLPKAIPNIYHGMNCNQSLSRMLDLRTTRLK